MSEPQWFRPLIKRLDKVIQSFGQPDPDENLDELVELANDLRYLLTKIDALIALKVRKR